MTTTPNSTAQGRIVEHAAGAIAAANDRGLRLDGEEEWRNYSRWADKPTTAPPRGTRVRLGLDASGYVRELQVLEDGAGAAESIAADPDRQIRRMSALRSAATFCGGKALSTEVSTADVLKIAEAFERWLLRDTDG